MKTRKWFVIIIIVIIDLRFEYATFAIEHCACVGVSNAKGGRQHDSISIYSVKMCTTGRLEKNGTDIVTFPPGFPLEIKIFFQTRKNPRHKDDHTINRTLSNGKLATTLHLDISNVCVN